MLLLIGFAFIAGIVTILSPCILPILPIVLSGSISGDKWRPWGVVIGFIASFTFFTLFLSTVVRATGISPDFLRLVAVVVVAGFGLALVLPGFQAVVEKMFSRLANLTPKNQKRGLWGGILIGLSLGLVWTPCVGPILAAIIALSFTGSVSGTAVAITFAYALGTAIPLLAIVTGGRALLDRNRWLVTHSAQIQKLFGVLMILTAMALVFNLDRRFQTFVLDKFPSYGTGLTKIEDNSAVRNQLDKLQSPQVNTPALENLGNAPEFIVGGQWFNSPPITLKQLKGKVVLVDFWTYTCINCIRTLPYIKAWNDKYAQYGLVIVGVHTPEFEFEKNPGNVTKAISDFGLKYPIMQDNNYATWRAYANRYWPAKYFVDVNGKIRFTHFGEGDYDESEAIIQKLLTEAGLLAQDLPISNPNYKITARTPELYLGAQRAEPGWFTLDGNWQQSDEFNNPQIGAGLTLDFEAKNAYLVMRPKAGDPGKVKVYLDDKLTGEITVDTDKLYDLVKLDTTGKHTLKLEFLDSNSELFAFTFG